MEGRLISMVLLASSSDCALWPKYGEALISGGTLGSLDLVGKLKFTLKLSIQVQMLEYNELSATN